MGVFLDAHNKGYNMAKMREYTFRSESGQEEDEERHGVLATQRYEHWFDSF